MMDSIAQAAMGMSTAKLANEYSIAVTKKAMDTQRLAAQEIAAMLPQQAPAVAKGQFIDVYA